MAKTTRHWTEYDPVCSAPIRTGPNKGQTATGTKTGYNRHWKVGEAACLQCRFGAASEKIQQERAKAEEHECVECGARWVNIGRGPIRYCSETCFLTAKQRKQNRRRRESDAYRQSERERYRRRAARTIGWRSCEGCGCLFSISATQSQKSRRRCGLDCCQRPASDCASLRTVEFRRCAWCDHVLVVATGSQQTLCSKSCRKAWGRYRNPEWLDFKRIYWRSCPTCEKPWYSTRKNDRVCCSQECIDQFYEDQKNPDKRYRNVADGTRRRVYERDRWICQLCEGPVDPDESGHFGPSIDHILPVSRGGSDHEWNLQLAHWICNVRRGNDLLDGQLGLPFALTG